MKTQERMDQFACAALTGLLAFGVSPKDLVDITREAWDWAEGMETERKRRTAKKQPGGKRKEVNHVPILYPQRRG